jgi:hypothetical protein
MLESLEKFAVEKGVTAPPAPGQTATTATAPAPAEPPKPADTPPAETPKPDDTPPAPAPAPEPKDKGKVNPWKLVDEHKAARAAAESRLAELQKLVPDPAAVAESKTRLESAEAKVKALEQTLGFLDYQQTEEFKTKHVLPYEAAWQKAAKELAQIQVKIPGTDQIRQATAEDLLTLVNMNVGEAQAIAQESFGPLAERMMAWRDKIRDLFDSQQDALKAAKENGDKWKKDQIERVTNTTKALGERIGKVFMDSNAAILKEPNHGKWLSKVEGDEELNATLDRGFAISKEAFELNPFDPDLTPEQQQRGARLHSAVYNRAAAYNRLLLENTRLGKKLEEAMKKLDAYKVSEPSRAPTPAGQSPPGELRGKARLQAALEKIAKPA